MGEGEERDGSEGDVKQGREENIGKNASRGREKVIRYAGTSIQNIWNATQ